jgi:hypothetical protein
MLDSGVKEAVTLGGNRAQLPRTVGTATSTTLQEHLRRRVLYFFSCPMRATFKVQVLQFIKSTSVTGSYLPMPAASQSLVCTGMTPVQC